MPATRLVAKREMNDGKKRHFYTGNQDKERLLLVQCEDGNRNSKLIACTSYCILDEKAQFEDLTHTQSKPAHVVFIINLARMSSGFTACPGPPWECVHIDDVRPASSNRPEICSLMGIEMPALFNRPSEDIDVSTSKLLMDSLHKAAARIEDSDQVSNRTTERIAILQSVMNHDITDGYRASGSQEDNKSDEFKDGIESGENDVDTSSYPPVFRVEGDNNIVIHRGLGSTININLSNKCDLPVVVDIINQNTYNVMPEVTSLLLTRLTAGALQENLEMNLQEQERRPDEQRESLLTKNRMLLQVCNMLAKLRGQLHKVHKGNEESVVFIVRFGAKANLERFLQAKKSGQLARDFSKCFETNDLEESTGCKISVKITIKEADCINGLAALETFMSVVKSRIGALLTEREQYVLQDVQHLQWLSEKALALSYIQESGTFRRSLWQQLVATVSPILAEIFAFYDYNCNLKILHEHPPNTWKHRLWLCLAANPKITPLHYSTFLPTVEGAGRKKVLLMDTILSSQSQHRFREKAPVRVIGSGGQEFTAVTPFSWVIKENLDRWYTVAFEQKAKRKKPLLEIFIDLVTNADLGRVLQHHILPHKYAEFMDGYIHDFTKMSYKTTTQLDAVDFELKCVKVSLKACVEATSRLQKQQSIENPVQGLVYLHTTYRQHVEKRLRQFSELVQACPELLNDKYQDILLTQGREMMLDVKAAEVLVGTHLVPSKREMTQPEAQKAWLCKIQTVKIFIENVITLVTKNYDAIYGEESRAIIKKIRPDWQRIRVLELFYEHVCIPTSEADERLALQGQLVWNAFHGGADLKRIAKIERLKRVLKMTTEKASELDFKFGIHNSCGICSPDIPKDIEDPVVLPCNHIWCEKCIRKWLEEGYRRCPNCNQQVPESFQPISTPQNRDSQNKFKIFRRNRNNFFFEVVSQLCFADNTAPEDGVVDGLLKFVTGQIASSPASAKQVIFDKDTINPEFTVRSVILQLLLQSCPDKVDNFLDNFFRGCQQASSAQLGEDVMVLCLMYLYSRENLLAEESQVKSSYDNLLQKAAAKLQHATKFLTDPSGNVPGPSIPLLQAIAEARYGLIVTAYFLHSCTIKGLKKETNKADKLFNEAQKFCMESVCYQEAHLFLLKQLCHDHGTNSLNHLSWHQTLSWVISGELKGRIQRIADGFVVSGATYTNIRDAMYLTVSQQNTQPLLDAVQVLHCSNNEKEAAVLLSLFREVTLSCAAMDAERRATEETKQALFEVIRAGSYTNKEMAMRLIRNRLCSQESNHLVVTPKQSYDNQMIIAFVVHSMVVSLCAIQDFLRRPLKKLLRQPREMRSSQVTTCILKEGQQHIEPSASVEEVDPVGSTILRMIVCAIMLGSAMDSPRAIANIVSSDLPDDTDVSEYLWNTMSSELKHLETLTRMTDEKCVLLIHVVLDRILTTQFEKREWQDVDEDISSSSPNWQREFVSTFISPVTKRIVGECSTAERKLDADKIDVVMQVLHKPESLETATYGDVRKLATLPTVWQYQPRISVENVHRYVESEQKKGVKQYNLLSAFLQQEPVLRAMIHLPDIIRLQRLLIERFHRCIDVVEAGKLSPADIHDKEIKRLMESFIAAWNQVIEIEGNQLVASSSLQDAHKYPLDIDNCNLALFLPTLTGDGVCSTELVGFLIESHNNFMELYHNITHFQEKRIIAPGSVTPSHLVAYDLKKDLLPLIHSHCCHTLQESSLAFNLDNLERAIEDHYVRGRPLIEKKVDELVFLEGALSNRVFQAIRKKVPQETLSVALRQDILSELKSITELCDCLAVTEIVIGFLASTGGHPNMYISEYLEKDLNLPVEQRQHLNLKVHNCQLRHTLSLWQLLAVERAKRRLASKKQDPFEGLGKHLKEKVPNNERDQLLRALRHVDVEDFVAELYEFIELHLTTMANQSKDSKQQPRLMKELGKYLVQKKQVLIGIEKMAARVHIPIQQAVDFWVLAVQSKRHRQHRHKTM